MGPRSVLVSGDVSPFQVPIPVPHDLFYAEADLAKYATRRGQIGFAETGANHATVRIPYCMRRFRIEAKTRGR